MRGRAEERGIGLGELLDEIVGAHASGHGGIHPDEAPGVASTSAGGIHREPARRAAGKRPAASSPRSASVVAAEPPRLEPACKHPAAFVVDGVCRQCGADVW